MLDTVALYKTNVCVSVQNFQEPFTSPYPEPDEATSQFFSSSIVVRP
jgi:hypothetical protein